MSENEFSSDEGEMILYNTSSSGGEDLVNFAWTESPEEVEAGVQPQPGPSGVQPQPGPAGVQPQPGPSGVQPQPGPSGVQPQPGPSGVQPQPAAAGVQPQPGQATAGVDDDQDVIFVKIDPAPVIVISSESEVLILFFTAIYHLLVYL